MYTHSTENHEDNLSTKDKTAAEGVLIKRFHCIISHQCCVTLHIMLIPYQMTQSVSNYHR